MIKILICVLIVEGEGIIRRNLRRFHWEPALPHRGQGVSLIISVSVHGV